MSDQISLYEKLGGEDRIARLLEDFYSRVLSDPELGSFFVHTPMNKLKAMQREFFSAALGGPQAYAGRSLAAAHHGHGINRRHFSKFCEHLFATLADDGVDQNDIDKVLAQISMHVGYVTGESGVDG
ncbi:MAG: group 1 truncated hemoglobin [Pirellulales bacterium]